ncbi:MAG: D-glycero-beta-D-manno-heptose 1,7-bisphosphate 7-phosphatase [Candidatus Aenigmarchaeota archaeon]|nr:D-glycero-beta-D-manno-heptose 1,7-bisphosphate 7-phosphatase [Candidatus Aenigmarchaeota archaeon]
MYRAVFLDRDGVINKESDAYIKSWNEFEFLPGSKEAIALLTKNNYTTFVITNQSGLTRGLITEASLLDIHRQMTAEIEQAGGKITEIYYCGHHPDDGCECRKPNTGMLESAVKDYGISLPDSYVVGDKPLDIEMGKRAGCTTILVRTGYGTDYEGPKPDAVADDLLAAAKLIIIV